MEKEIEFLEVHKQSMEVNGFWSESFRETIFRHIESAYKTEIITDWCVADMLINDGKVLVKWIKRHNSLSKEQLYERYGRTE